MRNVLSLVVLQKWVPLWERVDFTLPLHSYKFQKPWYQVESINYLVVIELVCVMEAHRIIRRRQLTLRDYIIISLVRAWRCPRIALPNWSALCFDPLRNKTTLSGPASSLTGCIHQSKLRWQQVVTHFVWLDQVATLQLICCCSLF